MKRLHITGSPRCGTTLMMEIMEACFNIDVFFKTEISTLVPISTGKPDNIICTKNPGDHLFLHELLECDPELWFLFMIRDPRDVIVSRHKLQPEQYWANLRQWNSAWDVLKELGEHRQLFIIRYEDLVRDPDKLQKEIIQWMPGLGQTHRFSDFHLHAKPSEQSLTALDGVRPVSDRSIGQWREHKPRIAGQLKIHGPITEALISLGYEKDASWLNELDGIKPDLTPGYRPDILPPEVIDNRNRMMENLMDEYRRTRGLAGKTGD